MAAIRHLSVSAIQDYLRCPLLWHGRRVARWEDGSDRGPMEVGTAIHAALSAHHRGGDAEHELVKHWRDTVLSEGHMNRLPQALKAVRAYAELITPHADDEPDKRFQFSIPGIPVPVLGFFDIRNKSFGLREFKTTAFPQSWTQEKVDDEFQATVYAMYCRQEDPSRNPEVRYTILGLGPEPSVQEFTTRRTDNDYLRARAMIRGVYQSMVEERLEAHCAPGKCPFPTQCAEFGYREPKRRVLTGPVFEFMRSGVAGPDER